VPFMDGRHCMHAVRLTPRWTCPLPAR